MINTFERAMKFASWLSVFSLVTIAAPALAQGPSQAQRDAVKSQCRSDYMAHCASIPPGGEASLQCLQKNMSSLSSSCQTAVRAVEAPAAATAKPADTAAPKAAAPAAAATAAPKAAERRPLPRPLRDSQAARRFPPFAAPAAPITQRFARACRPAARRRCSAWKRTRPNSRPVARRPSPPPVEVLQQRLRPRQARLRPPPQRRHRP